MKLATLLAQFLYTHKRLDLEGIGSFYLDSSSVTDQDNTRQQKPAHNDNIRFECNPGTRESLDLIQYISAQTGKMRALAAADLNSHIELVQQFLNIGKPFMFEGIGNLARIKAGQYEFTAGAALPERLKEISEKESAAHGGDDTYKPFLEKEKIKTAWKKPVMALMVVLGVGLAVWGGYSIYKKNGPVPVVPNDRSKEPAPARNEPDSAALKSEQTAAAFNASSNNNYKFILETANRKRAIARYNKLKEYNWNVQMETRDSMQYKLYLILPSLALDTSKVMDSLTALYGRRVYMEY